MKWSCYSKTMSSLNMLTIPLRQPINTILLLESIFRTIRLNPIFVVLCFREFFFLHLQGSLVFIWSYLRLSITIFESKWAIVYDQSRNWYEACHIFSRIKMFEQVQCWEFHSKINESFSNCIHVYSLITLSQNFIISRV